jgi:hypothetical protein
MIRQAFEEESMRCTCVFEWKSPNPLRPKKVRQVTSKVKRKLNIFFDFKGIVHKEFVMAGQTVNCVHYRQASMASVKMWEDFTLNSGNKRTGCCLTTTHYLTLPLSHTSFIHKGFLTTNIMTVIPTHPTCLTWPSATFLFPALKISPCWHNWGDEGRITGITEYPNRIWLLGCIKKWKECRERGLLWGCQCPVSPKLVFNQIAALVPEIMDSSDSWIHKRLKSNTYYHIFWTVRYTFFFSRKMLPKTFMYFVV